MLYFIYISQVHYRRMMKYLRELADTYIRGLLEVDAFIQDNLAQEDENNDL